MRWRHNVDRRWELDPPAKAVLTVLLLLAALTQARVVVGWQPGAPTRAQLQLERRAETASLQGRWAVAVFVLGSVVYGVALAAVLPPLGITMSVI